MYNAYIHPFTDLTLEEVEAIALTKYDIKRIHSYARNLLDYHAIMDLMPASMYCLASC